jgi:hypothetical protein
MRITGLVGVSTNSIRVAGVNARSTVAELRCVHVGEGQAVALQHLVEQAEGAAVVLSDTTTGSPDFRRGDGADRRHAGGEGEPGFAILNRGEVVLEAMRVGFCVRPYSNPLWRPSASCT